MDIRIVGTGSAVPSKVLTNDMLSQMVETDDEWIRTRTGIAERRIVEDENAFDLSFRAASAALDAALDNAGVERNKIAVVICASLGNKQSYCPSLACNLQRELGLREDILAFDLNAACSGFTYAMIVASRFISKDSCALVVGCDVLSQFVDFTDRSTCVLFGDGAGAAVVAPAATDDTAGAKPSDTLGADFNWVTEASGSDILTVGEYIVMDGQGVFKFAVETIVKNTKTVLAQAQLGTEDVDLFICHQANERIIKSAAKRLGVPLDRFFMNLGKYGNTSAASIPLALDEAVRAGLLKPGMKLVMAGFGGGLTAGALCMTWS